VTKPASQASTKAGLLRRAQLVAQLQHPNLTRLLPLPGGAGLTPVLKGLQRLGDFASADRPFGRLQLEHSLQLLLDVLNGLGALHELTFAGEGFVHGAVSPAQICIDGHGSGRLIPLLSSHVMTTLAPESNGYASPELLLGGNVDRRADLFSVGVLLWEALAGRRLFTDVSAAAVLARCSSDSLPGLVTPVHAQWAQPLCAVAARALSIQAADRFDSAGSFSAAIIGAAGPRLISKLGESWQDEAPTLVPRPGTYARPLPPPPPRRSFTPPGVTIELRPELDLKSDPTLVRPLPLEPAPVVQEPARIKRGTLFTHAQVRSAVIAITGLSLLVLAWWARTARDIAPVASAATPLATLAPAPSAIAQLVVASAPLPISVTTRPAALAAKAAPVVIPSGSAPRHQSSRPAPAKKTGRRPADSDYGI
jgi:serine/threonine-protein kinase